MDAVRKQAHFAADSFGLAFLPRLYGQRAWRFRPPGRLGRLRASLGSPQRGRCWTRSSDVGGGDRLILVSTSFLLLLVRHLLLVAMHLFLVAYCFALPMVIH